MTRTESPAGQPEPQGVVLDVIDDTAGERDSSGGSIIIPRWIALNGQSILVPRGTTITVSAADNDVVVATLTMMVRRARFGYADELGADPAFPAPSGGLQGSMETKDIRKDTRPAPGAT